MQGTFPLKAVNSKGFRWTVREMSASMTPFRLHDLGAKFNFLP